MSNNFVYVHMPDGMMFLAARIPSQQEQIQAARQALRTSIDNEMRQNTLRIQNPLTSRNERMQLHRRNDELIDELTNIPNEAPPTEGSNSVA
jgi:hypothetical protein